MQMLLLATTKASICVFTEIEKIAYNLNNLVLIAKCAEFLVSQSLCGP